MACSKALGWSQGALWKAVSVAEGRGFPTAPQILGGFGASPEVHAEGNDQVSFPILWSSTPHPHPPFSLICHYWGCSHITKCLKVPDLGKAREEAAGVRVGSEMLPGVVPDRGGSGGGVTRGVRARAVNLLAEC